MPRTDFDYLFSARDTVYSYELFLNAVAQFPAFCNEHRPSADSFDNLGTDESACRRELATLFAHIIYESGQPVSGDETSFLTGLQILMEPGCQPAPVVNPAECKYEDTGTTTSVNYPAFDSVDYFRRGPIGLRWNNFYTEFSKSYFDAAAYQSFRLLLADPDRMMNEPALLFASALWRYMVPRSPKASAHALISGMFEPNQFDKNLGVGNNFGSTIDAMALDSSDGQTSECNNGRETEGAQLRGEIYGFLLRFFKLNAERDLGCATTIMTNGGAGTSPSHWFYKDEN